MSKAPLSFEDIKNIISQQEGGENVNVEELLKQYQQMLSQQMGVVKEGDVDEEGGMMVKPQPCFVLKTKDQDGLKVFINVCMSEVVEAPQTKSLPDSDDTGLRIPLSMGEPREDFDKTGAPCRVYDVVFNPKVAEEAKSDPQLRQFLAELAFGYVEQKHKHVLNKNYIVPRLTYKGKSVPLQRIRQPKKGVVIQELSSTSNPSPSSSSGSKGKEEEDMSEEAQWERRKQKERQENLNKFLSEGSGFGQGECPEVQVKVKLNDGQVQGEEALVAGTLSWDAVKALAFIIPLPRLSSGRSVQLEVSDELLLLSVPGVYYLKMWTPSFLEEGSVVAHFDKKTRTLHVAANVLSPEERRTREEEVSLLPKRASSSYSSNNKASLSSSSSSSSKSKSVKFAQ